MKKNVAILLFLTTLLILFSGALWLRGNQITIGRADVSRRDFSVDNSYVFVTPIRARANAQEKVRITVFVLNNQGLGVLGKRVVLANNPDLNVDLVQNISDDLGKSIIDVASSKPGEYYIEVQVDGQILPQKAHVSFY
jgi:hypothetical protein